MINEIITGRGKFSENSIPASRSLVCRERLFHHHFPTQLKLFMTLHNFARDKKAKREGEAGRRA